MAHIQTVSTGFKVVTHVKGRVYRSERGQAHRKQPEQSLNSRVRSAAKQRRRVCLLSVRDAGWLEEYGVSQPCFGPGCTHGHHTRKEIERMVQAGQLRWVGDGKAKNVAAWKDDPRWVGKRSGGYSTMQLVDASRMSGKKHLAGMVEKTLLYVSE